MLDLFLDRDRVEPFPHGLQPPRHSDAVLAMYFLLNHRWRGKQPDPSLTVASLGSRFKGCPQ